MRAVQRTRNGSTELRNVEVAQCGAGEVLVDVLYSGVNPFDMQVLRGEIGDASRELTLGAEATGMLDSKLVLVSGAGLGAGRDGTFAEKVVAPVSAVRSLPDGSDPVTVATVGVAGKTAYRVVHQLAKVQPSDVVLVIGASGGVGTFAAQLARDAGAEVLAHTASAGKADALASLGLETIVANSPNALAEAVNARSVSLVLDPLGGDYLSTLLPVLKVGARAVTYGVLAGRETTIDLARLYAMGLCITGTSGATTSPEEAELALVGALRAVVDGNVKITTEVLPLSDAAEAFRRLGARNVLGKLLLMP